MKLPQLYGFRWMSEKKPVQLRKKMTIESALNEDFDGRA